MASSTTHSSLLLLLLLLPLLSHAATFYILNNCPYTVWAAAVPGGGTKLNSRQSWTIDVPSGTSGRVWARTGCSFDGSGNGSCQTGDCGGILQCTGNGSPPKTLAEFSLTQNQNLDYYDISLVDGFNVPIDIAPTSGDCKDVMCYADVVAQCPAKLRVTGGCNNPCTVFKTAEYCCTGSGGCSATNYSKYFKNLCKDAYSYPMDDATSTFSCPTGTNYEVTFCP